MGKIVERFEFRGDRAAAEAEALIDSGAGVSVIRRNVAERMSAHFLKLAPLTLHRVDGHAWVKISQVETMPRDVIVGVGFMQAWDIRLIPKNHDFTIGVDPDHIEMAGVGEGEP